MRPIVGTVSIPASKIVTGTQLLLCSAEERKGAAREGRADGFVLGVWEQNTFLCTEKYRRAEAPDQRYQHNQEPTLKVARAVGKEQNGGDSNAATLSPRGNERKCWAIHRQKKALQHHQMKNNNVPDWQYQFWVQGASRYSGKLHAKKHYYRKLAGERSYPKQRTPTNKSRRYRPEAIVFGACTTPLAFETGDAKREKN